MLKQVSLLVKGADPFNELSIKYGCKFDVIDCKGFNSHGMGLLAEITGERAEELIRELKTLENVRHVYFANSSPHKILSMLIVDTPLFCKVAQDAGAFCMSCPFRSIDYSSENDSTHWKLMIKDANGLGRAIDLLKNAGAEAEVREVSNAMRNDALTPRQREILLTAIRLGHFEFPRKIDLTELAEKLSIKPSTLSEILRRAEAKIAQYYLDSVGTHSE